MAEPPRPTPTPYPWEEGGTLPQATPLPADSPLILELEPSAAEDPEDMTREEMRNTLRFWTGYELPATTTDLFDVATALQGLDKWAETIQGTPMANFPGVQDFLTVGSKALVRRLSIYAEELFGDKADARTPQYRSAFEIFSTLLRPPEPSIEQKPTAEEFMSDFNTAYTASIENLKQTGQISQEEANFAQEVLRPELLNEYIGELSKFAETGASPFALREVTAEERLGKGATTAQRALEAGVGKGVEEPTRIKEELEAEQVLPPDAGPAEQKAWAEKQKALTRRATELREGVEDIGRGRPREFIALPRLMPADFLQQALDPEAIQLKYAGSPRGAQAGARPAAPGFVSSPRRL